MASELAPAAWRYWRRSRAPIRIARGVSGVCRELLETIPATGSNCKSRDYRRVCYPNGSTPRMWGNGSPSTHRPSRYQLPRTREHHHQLGQKQPQACYCRNDGDSSRQSCELRCDHRDYLLRQLHIRSADSTAIKSCAKAPAAWRCSPQSFRASVFVNNFAADRRPGSFSE